MNDPGIIFTERQGRVHLDMAQDDWNTLLLMLGFATGANQDIGEQILWLAFVNRLNATNPRFTPYKLPKV